MKYLLDTSALLAHFSDEEGAEKLQDLFDSKDAQLLVASVSLPEFARRLRELGMSEQESLHVLDQYLLVLEEVVPVDGPVARGAFEIICKSSERLPLIDSLIAAAARSSDAILIHRDRHMRAIPASMLTQLDLESGKKG
jgi:predicted nucleic acid-binding protein